MEPRNLDFASLSECELPFNGTFYPLGFPVNLASNSREALACARESWGMWAAEFDAQPIEARVVVQPEGELAPEPEYGASGHLFSIVSDRHNYAVLDLDRLFGYAFVSRDTVADHSWFRWYFLDPLALFQLAQRHALAVHAACIAREGRGILLAGESCAGKSTLAWACARAGWTYVADDAAWLPMQTAGREVLGRSDLVRFRPEALEWFPELEGLVSRVRPNGKLSIEVPTNSFPNIRTASRCEPEAVVFLDRSQRHPPGFERMDAVEAAEELLGDRSKYWEETRARYRTAVRRLMQAPSYRMRYKSLEEGIALLGDLHTRLGS